MLRLTPLSAHILNASPSRSIEPMKEDRRSVVGSLATLGLWFFMGGVGLLIAGNYARWWVG